MAIVNCDNTKCLWCEREVCQAEKINLSSYGTCWTEEDITDGEEYQEEYWIRTKHGDGTILRQQKHGKKVELCGLTFYTEDDIRTEKDRDQARMTEATTGYACVPYSKIEANIEHIKQEIAKVDIPLMDLPPYDLISG
jgi:hypothetical protein